MDDSQIGAGLSSLDSIDPSRPRFSPVIRGVRLLALPDGKMRNHKLLVYVLPLLALLIGGTLLWYRGTSRALNSNRASDWSSPYVGARLWLKGANPYDSSSFASEASKVGLM